MPEALQKYVPPVGRMRLIEGINESLLIDDSYNSSPVAVIAALETLRDLEVRGRRIVVLGDMLELGTFSMEEHVHIGEVAAEVADIVIAVGVRAQGIAQGVGEKREVHVFSSTEGVADLLQGIAVKGDVILVKGSQGVRLERVTEKLIRDATKASSMLVRQDVEWKKR